MQRGAMIFLIFSLVMTGVSTWCVATGACIEMTDYPPLSVVELPPQDLRTFILAGSPVIGPWIVLLAVSCLGLGMAKKKGA